MLAVLFGGIGLHNFYSGHYGSGAIKFGLFFIGMFLDIATGFQTGFSLLFGTICWLWAIIQAFVVKTDALGNSMS